MSCQANIVIFHKDVGQEGWTVAQLVWLKSFDVRELLCSFSFDFHSPRASYTYCLFYFRRMLQSILYCLNGKVWTLLSYYLNVFVVLPKIKGEILKTLLSHFVCWVLLLLVSLQIWHSFVLMKARRRRASHLQRHLLRRLMKHEAHFLKYWGSGLTPPQLHCASGLWITPESVPAELPQCRNFDRKCHRRGGGSCGESEVDVVVFSSRFLRTPAVRICPESRRYWNIHVDREPDWTSCSSSGFYF